MIAADKGAGCETTDTDEYQCEGSGRVDCIIRAQEKCVANEDCKGITWQDNMDSMTGVAVCRNVNLVSKIRRDWNIIKKCQTDVNGKDFHRFYL